MSATGFERRRRELAAKKLEEQQNTESASSSGNRSRATRSPESPSKASPVATPRKSGRKRAKKT